MSSRRRAGRDPLDSITIHIGDWCTSTTVSALGEAGEARYLRLLMHQWLSEGEGLPADPQQLRSILRLPPREFAAFWLVAEPKFPVDPDGKRRNPRTHAEWLYCRDNRDSVRQRASKGGAAKAAQAVLKQRPSSARAVLDECPSSAPSPSPSSLPNSRREDAGATARPADAHSGARFADPAHEAAYRRARLAARIPEALDAVLDALASGLGGPRGRPLTPHQIGTALLEAQAANRECTAQTLRTFAAKVAPAPERGTTPDADPPGTVRDGSGRLIVRGAA